MIAYQLLKTEQDFDVGRLKKKRRAAMRLKAAVQSRSVGKSAPIRELQSVGASVGAQAPSRRAGGVFEGPRDVRKACGNRDFQGGADIVLPKCRPRDRRRSLRPLSLAATRCLNV